MRRRDVLAGMGTLALGAGAARAADTMFAGADIAGDIDILQRAYTLMHPGLYRYATPDAVARRFAGLKQAWSRDQTRSEAFTSLSRFLGTVRCGHTYANFYNQKDAVADELFGGRDKLPVQFRLFGDRMVVTKNLSADPHLAPGAEILSIDGRSPREIVAGLLPYVRADGSNDAKRRALLEVRGEEAYETFDVFHPRVLPARDGVFSLRVRPAGSRRAMRIEVPAIDLVARRAARSTPRDRNAPQWTLAWPDAATALLTMPNWALYNSTWDWRGFLDAAFDEIQSRGARALVVDLRANEGGLDCGDEIVARCIDSDIGADSNRRLVRFRTAPQDLWPYLDTWDNSFREIGKEASEAGGGFFRLADSARAVIKPKGPRFRGQLFVLTGPQNSSATFQFAGLVQRNRLGRLVGGPTGGNQRGINGGAYFFLRLPKSGLEADLPLIGYFPDGDRPDAGLSPDVLVEPRVEDVAEGRDRVMEMALALAKA